MGSETHKHREMEREQDHTTEIDFLRLFVINTSFEKNKYKKLLE